MLAETTQTYDDTENEMKANIKFFDEMKRACSAKSSEWAERKALREEEKNGIEEAIKILNSDEARELFSSAIKPGAQSFLQLSSQLSSALAGGPAALAYAVLKKHAARSHSIRLATLAAEVHSAKSGHFDKVMETIDTIIQTIKEEEQADISKRDQCKDEYLKIESTVEDLSWKIEKNVAHIEKLEALIALREEERVQTIEAIEDVTKEIGAMEEMRIDENTKFKEAKSEDEQAIELLEQAKTALAAFYEKHTAIAKDTAFISQEPEEPVFQVSEDQAPDATFSHKGKRKHAAKGVLSLLSIIQEDLRSEIKEGIRDEGKAQLDFEARLDAAKQLKQELEDKKVNLDTAIAEHKEEMADEHTKMESNQKDKDDELAYKKDIKPDCDWIIGAYEKRRDHRQAEMEGLTEAKEFLAGYEPASASFISKGLRGSA